MNDDLKIALQSQGERMREAILRADNAKSALETFDAHSRTAIKADGVKRTEADTDALVTIVANRAAMESAMIVAKAELEGVKVDTQCLLARVSLICSETAAMSRISQ